jgi:hypothetical protein
VCTGTHVGACICTYILVSVCVCVRVYIYGRIMCVSVYRLGALGRTYVCIVGTHIHICMVVCMMFIMLVYVHRCLFHIPELYVHTYVCSTTYTFSLFSSLYIFIYSDFNKLTLNHQYLYGVVFFAIGHYGYFER